MIRNFFTHWYNSFQGLTKAVWLLSFVNLINRMGSMVLIFLSVYLTQSLGYDIREAGYVMTCFGLGALVGMMAGGWATDKFGYYPIQIFSLVGNGLLLLVMLLVKDIYALAATVFILSLIAEMFRPANQVALVYYSTPETRTRSLSLLRMAFNLGFTIAPALGGIIAHQFGWDWLFWADGLTCIGAAIALRILLKPVKVEKAAPNTEILPDNHALHPLKDRLFMVFTFLIFIGALSFMQLIWTVPVFFKDAFHWSEDTIGYVIALNGLFVFFVEMPLVFFLESRYSLVRLIKLGLLCYAVSYLFFLMPFGALTVAVLYMLFISLGEILVMPFSGNFAYNTASKKSNKGQYLAIFGMAYSIANVIAPFTGTQIIAAWGFDVLWLIVAAEALIAWAGFTWLGTLEARKPTVSALL